MTDKKPVTIILLLVLIVGLVVPNLIGSSSTPVDSAIPPTPAFVKIATNDTDATTNPAWLNATKYDDNFWILTDGSILIEVISYTGAEE